MSAPAPNRLDRKSTLRVSAAALVLLALDRFLKSLALRMLERGDIPAPDHAVAWYPSTTSGVLFDAVPGSPWMLVFLTGVTLAIFFLVWQAYTRSDRGAFVGLLLIAAGSTSNVFDRFRFDAVVDYLVLPTGAIVNLADGMILTGAALLVVRAFRPTGGTLSH